MAPTSNLKRAVSNGATENAGVEKVAPDVNNKTSFVERNGNSREIRYDTIR